MNFGYFFDQTKNEKKPLTNVTQWLDKNTFYSLDYNNLYALYSNKSTKTISLVMPALNEESTVGTIIETIFQELNKEYQIIDEFVLIDGGSTDRTLEIVSQLTKKYDLLKLVQEKNILPNAPFKKGKGNQLWKGLEYSRNLMTIRISKILGIEKILDLSKKLEIYDEFPDLLSVSL